MPVQTQVSDLAAIFGGRLSGANEQHKDKPVDKGFQKLPPGMKNAIAQLQVLEFNKYKDEKKGKGTQGKVYFRASAVVVYSGNPATPHEHRGVRVLNMQTTLFFNADDMPEIKYEGGTIPATTLEQNFKDVQNIFKMFGMVCPETRATDPTGHKTSAFYRGAIQALTNPKQPRYVLFSTSEPWKRKRANESQEAYEKREGTVFERWHDQTEWNGITNPAESVNLVATSNGQATATNLPSAQPNPDDNPPTIGADGLPLNSSYDSVDTKTEMSIEDHVAALVKISDEGNEIAQESLSEMAIANGWTQEEIEDPTNSWKQVGEMALNPPATEDEEGDEGEPVTVGSKWNFTKRDKNGTKLRDDKGVELPSQEVEIVTVDEATNTCTVKVAKTGRHVTDMRTRKPIQVKFEWLE